MNGHSLPYLSLALILAGCVQDPGLGPDLGRCADYPDGVYTYGQAGIGTCLAGPADMQFLSIGGESWLAITNADPFRNYTSGSLLLIETADLEFADSRVRMDELAAWSMPLDHYLGQIGYDRSTGTAYIPSRVSSDSFVVSAEDHVWLVDLADPRQPVLRSDRSNITVRQDPYAIAVDEFQRRVFVANSTDHSLSVIDASTIPPRLVDPAPRSIVTTPELLDFDASGTVAEIIARVTPNQEVALTDRWTATWVDGTWRAWLPQQGPDGLELRRWSNGGADWVTTGVDADLVPDTLTPEVRDPWLGLRNELLTMWFSTTATVTAGEDTAQVSVIRAASTDGSAAGWSYDGIDTLIGEVGGYDQFLGGPSIARVGERAVMFFHARATANGPASIGSATTSDSVSFSSRDEPILTAPEGFESIEHPSPMVDPLSGDLRMWMGMWDGTAWSIGHAWSSDAGTTWDTPEVVFELGSQAEHVAAPIVVWSGGRYRMWLAWSDGISWWHAESWSWDGLDWSDPVPFLEADADFDLATPPRVGLQGDPSQGWRIQGIDTPPISNLLTAGLESLTGGLGMSLRAASGYVLGTDAVGLVSARGIEPGSYAEVGGRPTLFATATDSDGRDRLVSLVRLGETWATSRSQLIAEGSGGNVHGTRSPLAFEHEGTWHLLYAANEADFWTLRHAGSPDGLDFTPTAGSALTASPGGWASGGQFPRSLEVLEDGSLRVWYSGYDGSRYRIGSATSQDGISWSPEPGLSDPYQLGSGRPGTFDDTSLRDPMVVRQGDQTVMWYAGFDGEIWQIGAATRNPGGGWDRRISAVSGNPEPVLPAMPTTFAARGVLSPVVAEIDGELRMWYGGFDGDGIVDPDDTDATRIGEASIEGLRVFPEHRFPTTGDQITWTSRRGQPGRSTIRLGQVIEGITLPGADGNLVGDGPTKVIADSNRGFLFVASKSFPGVWVIDTRDDTTTTFDDLNALDIEAMLRVETTTGQVGIQDMVLAPDGKLYLATREPDAIVVVDTSDLIDDDKKDFFTTRALGAIPVHDLTDDAGDRTFAPVGAAGMALVPGQDLLLMTHFRDNSLSFCDLAGGEVGEEVRYLPDIGENPSMVRVSPDGSYAVISNYLGTVTGDVAGSSLVIVDLRPESPTYLEITRRVVNR